MERIRTIILDEQSIARVYGITSECIEAWQCCIGDEYLDRTYEEETDDKNEEKAKDMGRMFNLHYFYYRTTSRVEDDTMALMEEYEARSPCIGHRDNSFSIYDMDNSFSEYDMQL